MRQYSQSDIFAKMNAGNSIIRSLQNSINAINDSTIINSKIYDSLDILYKNYHDTITLKAITAIKEKRILILYLPINVRFPANIPYIKIKNSKGIVAAIDLSKYANIEYDDDGKIDNVSIDIPKFYNLLIPALIALDVLNDKTVIATEPSKYLAKMWAKMFCHILKSQRIFVANAERYEAFMYFAMRFFMIYYLNMNVNIVDRISSEYIGNVKSKYILMIESNCKQKNINLYADWESFARNMFSNEITNIKSTNVAMNVEEYIRLFCNYLGRDGAYLALWSADLFFFCLFNVYNHSWILNDRAWGDIIDDEPKAMQKIQSSLYREL